MSLVFAAVLPNAPELTQELTPGFSGKHSATVQALQELNGECYFMKPDTIILFTEHDSVIPELLSANIDSTLESAWYSSMDQPDDLNHLFHTDIALASRFKEAADTCGQNIPLTIHAEHSLSPETSTPLIFALQHLNSTQVIVISTSEQMSVEEHHKFGQFLHHEIQQTNKRIAVFASGRLSNARNNIALDTIVQTAVREQDPQRILKANADVVEQSGTDIIKPLAALLGVVENTNTRCEMLSYEQLHNHGLAVINFILQ